MSKKYHSEESGSGNKRYHSEDSSSGKRYHSEYASSGKRYQSEDASSGNKRYQSEDASSGNRRYQSEDASSGNKRYQSEDASSGNKRYQSEDASSGNKRRKSEGPVPVMYSVFQGEVASVKDYGLFVKIPGNSRQGLVHKSQISKSRVEDPSEMFAKGEMVYCKVISVQEDGEKIGLAMKSVNQTTGQDQDPNNIELSQDEKKRRQFGDRSQRQKIVLEAVLDTTCRKCGGKGHLAQDCFKTGEASYDLIPDLDDYMQSVGSEQKQSPPKKHKNKEKKHKEKSKKKEKRKKKKERKNSSSDSEDSDSDHKQKKKKGRKKKHRESSSSDSSDSDSDHHRRKSKDKKKKKH